MLGDSPTNIETVSLCARIPHAAHIVTYHQRNLVGSFASPVPLVQMQRERADLG